MSTVEKFQTHLQECPQCSKNVADPSKLCQVGATLLSQVVKESK